MANRKTRKFSVKNQNQKIVMIQKSPSQSASVATLEKNSNSGKQPDFNQTEELNSKLIKNYSNVGREIKRSIVCAAITFGVLAVLYFIFR